MFGGLLKLIATTFYPGMEGSDNLSGLVWYLAYNFQHIVVDLKKCLFCTYI